MLNQILAVWTILPFCECQVSKTVALCRDNFEYDSKGNWPPAEENWDIVGGLEHSKRRVSPDYGMEDALLKASNSYERWARCD